MKITLHNITVMLWKRLAMVKDFVIEQIVNFRGYPQAGGALKGGCWIFPVHLRDPELSLNSFKTKLKTHFFS